LVASVGVDGTITLWETERFELRATLRGHNGLIYGVALSADGKLLASGGADETVRVWDTDSGALLSTLRGHSGVVSAVALSRDGHLLASGGDDGIVRIWDTRSGACLHTLRSDRHYQRLDITGLTGVTEAQRAALLALGAIETPELALAR